MHDDELDEDGDEEVGILQGSNPQEENGPQTNSFANSMMRTVVSSGNDALNILFEAAAVHSRENEMIESEMQSRNTRDRSHRTRPSNGSRDMNAISPEALAKAVRPVELSHAAKDVLAVWETCRFVRMGWFTSREAVTFIDLLVGFALAWVRRANL